MIPLTQAEINTLANINKYDWASVEPSIFGTLFERTLDPAKRSQIGAHYTSRADIETLLEAGPAGPAAARVGRGQAEVRRGALAQGGQGEPGTVGRSALTLKDRVPERKAFDRAILDFAERLAHVTVLDPACGSGNFLYVAIHMLLDLEKEVIAYASDRGLSLVPQVNPAQLHGLEINPYAQQLAQVVIWIGYLQWMHYNGFKMPDHPVLTPIETIKQHGRDPGPFRPGASEGAGVAGGGVHRGESAVSGWKATARRIWVTSTSIALFNVWETGCRARRTFVATGLRRRGGRSRLASAGARACWRRRESAAASNRKVLERIKATGESSLRRATGTGFSTALPSIFPWWGSIQGTKRRESSTAGSLTT